MRINVEALQGVSNFRDLGGYKTQDGRKVKSGYFFRAAHLNKLTDSDIQHLEKGGLKLICDYRADFEREESPNVSVTGANTVRLRVDLGAHDIRGLALKGKLYTLGPASEILVDYNRRIVSNFQPYKKLFELILEQENLPMVQHCSAGKDRTGFGVALILLALGVPTDTVMEDYLLSNHFREEDNKVIVNDLKSSLKNEDELAVLTAMLEVREEYLEAAFDEIQKKYGSINYYLEEALGLTKEKQLELQERFLE